MPPDDPPGDDPQQEDLRERVPRLERELTAAARRNVDARAALEDALREVLEERALRMAAEEALRGDRQHEDDVRAELDQARAEGRRLEEQLAELARIAQADPPELDELRAETSALGERLAEVTAAGEQARAEAERRAVELAEAERRIVAAREDVERELRGRLESEERAHVLEDRLTGEAATLSAEVEHLTAELEARGAELDRRATEPDERLAATMRELEDERQRTAVAEAAVRSREETLRESATALESATRAREEELMRTVAALEAEREEARAEGLDLGERLFEVEAGLAQARAEGEAGVARARAEGEAGVAAGRAEVERELRRRLELEQALREAQAGHAEQIEQARGEIARLLSDPAYRAEAAEQRAQAGDEDQPGGEDAILRQLEAEEAARDARRAGRR